jgi:signal transduction histidine kinase
MRIWWYTLGAIGHEISQVIINLLFNAHDAIKKLTDRWMKIYIEEDNNFILIKITDSGEGIDINIVEKIMQPFFSTKEIGKGTGLGLSLSFEIIKKHNGFLFYDPDAKNTTFVIKLPIHQPHSEEVI